MTTHLKEAIWNRLISRLPRMNLRLTTKHGPMTVCNKDRFIARDLFAKGEFDYDEIETGLGLLIRLGLIKRNNTGILLDIGANIGTVCIPIIARDYFAS